MERNEKAQKIAVIYRVSGVPGSFYFSCDDERDSKFNKFVQAYNYGIRKGFAPLKQESCIKFLNSNNKYFVMFKIE